MFEFRSKLGAEGVNRGLFDGHYSRTLAGRQCGNFNNFSAAFLDVVTQLVEGAALGHVVVDEDVFATGLDGAVELRPPEEAVEGIRAGVVGMDGLDDVAADRKPGFFEQFRIHGGKLVVSGRLHGVNRHDDGAGVPRGDFLDAPGFHDAADDSGGGFHVPRLGPGEVRRVATLDGLTGGVDNDVREVSRPRSGRQPPFSVGERFLPFPRLPRPAFGGALELLGL